MCGIAGFSGQFEPALLAAMSERIAHRGPDDADALVLRSARHAPVGLAHRRLSIIDLSPLGRQPMELSCPRCGVARVGPPEERLWLTYNGELYNHIELRAELEGRGHRFFSQCDTEVILHLYADEGAAMLSRLNGIFAFGLFDGRPTGRPLGVEQGDILLARDGLGVKPLYVAETPRGVLFASELKALLVANEVSRDLDPEAMHNYLTFLWCPAPRTPLRGVRKVAPGEALVLRGGKVAHRHTYYTLPYGRPPLTASTEEVAELVAQHVRQAVERQLIADVPVGSFLSGGLDSSSIVAFMRQLQPDRRIACYTIGGQDWGDGADSPDLPYARRVAAHLDVDLTVVPAGASMLQHLPSMLHFLDEPQADPAPIFSLLIARQARQDGVKVLMSGAGGDDLFTGYGRHHAIRLERLWRHLPSSLRRRIAAPARAVYDGRSTLPGMTDLRVRRLAKLLAYADLPDDQRLAHYFFWGGESLRRGLYSPAMTAALQGVDSAAPLLASLALIPDERDPIQRSLFLDTRHFLADHNLNYADKTGMAEGVEIRVPLLDLDLVALAARVPSHMKIRRGVAKAIFKQAMEPYLPRDVIYRPKAGFGAPVRRWVTDDMRPLLDDLLSADSLRKRGLYDPAAVDRLRAATQADRVDGAWTVFSLACIELWMRIFVDGGGAAPTP